MSAGKAKVAVAAAVALAMASGAHHHHHHGLAGVLDAMPSVTSMGTYSQSSWARAELRTIGDPRTPANVASLVAWQNREGGGGANNPLNTTEPAPGSTVFNSVGVQSYPTSGEGVAATAVTLRNGNYGDVLSALASGRGLCGRSFTGLHNWSAGPGAPASQGYWNVC